MSTRVVRVIRVVHVGSCWFVLVRVPSNGSCCSCRFVSVRVGSCQFVFVVPIRVALVSIRVAHAGLC